VVNAQSLGNPPARYFAAKLSLRTTVRRKEDESENEAERKPLHSDAMVETRPLSWSLWDDASQVWNDPV